MGRRKERRIAAAAGRRVKLDLFAEPSGGLGAQNEVGGDDDDTKNQVGLSNSPSSSGLGTLNGHQIMSGSYCHSVASLIAIWGVQQGCFTFLGKQPEDPLALLGQYSDDESDGNSSGSSGEQRRAVVQDFIDTLDKPAQVSTVHGSGGSDMEEVNGHTSQKGEQPAMETTAPSQKEIVQKMEDSHYTEGIVTVPEVMMEENDTSKEKPPNSDAQEAKDVISGWKIVLHEESNQHYYWNVTTGETSWEIPDVLAQQTNENMETTNIDEEHKHSKNEDLEDNKDSVDLCHDSFPPIKEQNHEASSPGSNVFSRETHDDYEGAKHLQSYLLKHYEDLLEKVNFVEGYKCEVHGHDQMLKYSWELEIRVADIKALELYESSLVPYWEYCKGRFLQLEAAVNDVLQCIKCKELDEVYISHEARENSSDDKVENLCQNEPDCASGDLNVPYCGNESERIADKNFESTEKTEFNSEEDVDMDVDMDVEDIAPNISTENPQPLVHEQIISIPPAPDDDWVPPPPPDTEPIPPPPPDEPLTQQSFSYPENFSYSNPHFQYYGGQADSELHNSNVYANAEAYQQTVYYEASVESYGPPTLAVNPVLPSVYFGVQEGSLQPTHNSYGVSIDSVYKDSTVTSDASGVSLGMIPHSEAPPIQEPFSVSSVPNVTESVKGQSKVVRTRKRTVAAVSSLRSNKKVSSLVDKWKAAKEELEEEEEAEKEPKNAYEKLEMKRNRAIEEWRAQQIASGEAKDNANFQPLGCDWRERVKRKRARLAKESSSTSPSDGGEGKQQPDLIELSKGLPSTWQVYWDESSKQAYYANSVTLETTWIRPTN